MKRIKTLGILGIALLSLSATSAFALYTNPNIRIETSGAVKVGDDTSVKTDSNTDVKANIKDTDNDSINGDDKDNDQDNEKDDDSGSKASLNAESHGSAVSAFVKSLLSIAGREGGIGAQVREVANTQNESEANTSAAITKVETRSKVKTFFFGTDYKSISILRSEMIKTGAQITALQKLSAQITNISDKAMLDAQIKVLQDEQVKIQALIDANINTLN